MMQKRLICPQRLRHLPARWSWIDHRLVRDEWLIRCRPSAWALYLFLVTVGDAQGLSYYSERAILRRLQMDAGQLGATRAQLQEQGLIAYQAPLYQVLDLAPSLAPSSSSREQGVKSVGELLRQALEKGARHD